MKLYILSIIILLSSLLYVLAIPKNSYASITGYCTSDSDCQAGSMGIGMYCQSCVQGSCVSNQTCLNQCAADWTSLENLCNSYGNNGTCKSQVYDFTPNSAGNGPGQSYSSSCGDTTATSVYNPPTNTWVPTNSDLYYNPTVYHQLANYSWCDQVVVCCDPMQSTMPDCINPNSPAGGGGGGQPTGWVNSTNSNSCQYGVSGWACLTDGTQVKVDVYENGAYGQGGTYLSSVTANQYNSGASQYCGGNGNVGFTYYPPKSQVGAHSYYFYGNTGSSSWLINNSPQNVTCPSYTISGTVYMDYDHDGSGGTADVGTSGIPVSLGGISTTTNSNGFYSFSNLAPGTYSVSITIPSGDTAVGKTSQSVTVGPNNITNFYITPLYTISGTIFNDINLNTKYDTTTETAFTNGSQLTISGPVNTTATASNGVYSTAQNLLSGTYTVSYNTTATPLPSGYRLTTPTSWQVVVGNPASNQSGYMCSTGASPDATCTNPNSGSIANLNFGLTNESAWGQGVCTDIRVDTGYSQQIPSTASCGNTSGPYAIMNNNTCTTNPGVLFSGSTNPNYGQGTGASTSNYQVGNFLFPETYNDRIPNTSDTSYSFVTTTLQNVATPPTPLKDICPDLTNCVLSEATPGGVYTTSPSDGPVSISVSNTDGTYQLGAANYTFVIGNTLTFTSNLMTQTGYSTTFSAAGDIHVAGSIGETNWQSLSPDLEGFFSTDSNFDIDSANPVGQQCLANGQPNEKKLNILGSVITNAAGKGGSIVNSREGCAQDLSCPTYTITSSPTMILHVSGALKPPYTLWQEQNP